MMPLASYTRPLARDLRSRRMGLTLQRLVLIAAASLATLILAHAVLRTLVALPILLDPAMVPGCC